MNEFRSSAPSKFLENQPLFAAAITVAAIFSILIFSGIVRLTLAADDFDYLTRLYSQNGLHLSDFSRLTTRTPVWIFFANLYYHLPKADQMVWPPILTYWIYSLSIVAFLAKIRILFSLRPESQVAFLAAIALICYPTHFELLYWLCASSYMPGFALWVLSLYAPGAWAAVPLAASFLISETFILPSFALFVFHTIEMRAPAKPEGFWTSLRPRLPIFMPWLLAVSLFVVIRKSVQYSLGATAFSYDLNFDVTAVLTKAIDGFFQIYSIYFYRPYWPNSIVLWFVFLFLIWTHYRLKTTSPIKLFLLLAAPYLATSILWVFGHAAPRALFGAQILASGVLFYLITALPPRTAKRVAAVLIVVFTTATASILIVKTKNTRILVNRELEWRDKMNACEAPCRLEISKLDQGIANDFVLHRDFWESFLYYVKNKYAITKPIDFVIVEESGR